MFITFPTGSDKALFGMPWFTIGTIAVCVLVHIANITGVDVISAWGYRPADGLSLNILSSTLVHGGILHLFFNMVFLWCMGINLETRWGTGPFAAVYVVGGIVATLAYASLHRSSTIPLIGASGAISAAMGAFLISLYKERIRIVYLYWILFRAGGGSVMIPAYVVLPFLVHQRPHRRLRREPGIQQRGGLLRARGRLQSRAWAWPPASASAASRRSSRCRGRP